MSGSLLPTQTASINVEIGSSAVTMPAGQYSGFLAFQNLTNSKGNVTTTVLLIIDSGSAYLTVTPTSTITFRGKVGGPFVAV